MAARAEYDLHPFLAQEIVGAHHVVEILDLMVDVLHTGVRRREQGERVMDGADAKERRVADPVRHARVEEPRPEGFVARSIGGAQPDVAEMRDPRVACGEIALTAVKRPHHDLDLVAGRVLEREEPLHAAQLAFLLRAVTHDMAGFLDLRARLVEVVPVLEIEGDDNLLPLIKTEVKNGVLEISNEKSLSTRNKIRVRISIQQLNGIETSGASDIVATNVKSDQFKIDTSGASDLKVSGEAKSVSIDSSGAGNIDTKDLHAEKVNVSSSGAATAEVYATEELTASVSGGGNIDYYGNPKTVKEDKSGAGTITKR